jgi:hypothetical protein
MLIGAAVSFAISAGTQWAQTGNFREINWTVAGVAAVAGAAGGAFAFTAAPLGATLATAAGISTELGTAVVAGGSAGLGSGLVTRGAQGGDVDQILGNMFNPVDMVTDVGWGAVGGAMMHQAETLVAGVGRSMGSAAGERTTAATGTPAPAGPAPAGAGPTGAPLPPAATPVVESPAPAAAKPAPATPAPATAKPAARPSAPKLTPPRSAPKTAMQEASTCIGSAELCGGNSSAAGGGPRLLSQFTQSTVDDVVGSAGRLSPGGQITEGARAIAKKLGHAQSGGYSSAFAGVKPTQANAESIIRSTLENPARTFYGDKVIDVYNAAGQGVRFDRATNVFRGFLEGGLATQ